ncbi:MAG: ABC transporter substrate-binding protein [Oscillospiraceae bacterium]|nr:ABC transporter substrate-binding protein [Oscillospiraceae bacterium]
MKYTSHRAAALTLAAALLLTLCACSAVQSDPHTDAPYYTFTDALGQTVTLTHKPQRVAVLFSSFADLWQTAGGEVAITVGESVERGFADASAILVDDGAGKTINSELLLAAQPDFILCSADIEAQVNTAALMQKAGISSACLRVETFDDYLAALRICTGITGDTDAYRKHGEAVKSRIDALFAALDEDQPEKRILFIRAGSGAGATKAKTAAEHFAAAMLRELGTYNIAENAPILLDGLSIEEILREDPDYIFISPMGSEEAARAHMDTVLAQSTWQSLTAVQNGCYVYLPKDLFQFKPNARWAEAYEYLIETLYEKEK